MQYCSQQFTETVIDRMNIFGIPVDREIYCEIEYQLSTSSSQYSLFFFSLSMPSAVKCLVMDF